jgi:hypothetical protein
LCRCGLNGRDARVRPGDLEWDTDTGRIAGSLAPEVSAGLKEAKAAGAAGWGPRGCLEYPITDPLHKPTEMAVILDAMGFVLPAELVAAYHIPPADLLDDPEPRREDAGGTLAGPVLIST